jgi:four helix bundle protein
MQTYKDLDCWKRSIQLVKRIYQITATFPREELYGLTNQIRRSAVSIPSNIAEGYARKGKKENAYFVNIAYASGTELETQIIIATELLYIAEETSTQLLNELIIILKLLYNY